MRAVRVVLAIVLGCATVTALAQTPTPKGQPVLSSRSVPVLTIDGSRFRDLNRNGALDPYEDWRLGADRRAADLVSRMTLDEKAGTMMHGTAPAPFGGPPGSGYDLGAAERIILGNHLTTLLTRLAGGAGLLAEQSNALQAIAERSRLGIPLTISSDPRHHFEYTLGASNEPGQFSRWPETLGLAAIGDAALVRRFGDIARQEYRAVGLAMALSPQADLATEPRWPRNSGTFGEDPDRVRALVQAYVEGFQGGATGLGAASVATVVKHWVGYGASVDGFDGHNYYGRFGRLDGAFDQHVRAFEGAFQSKVAGVMPTYTILQDVAIEGAPIEQVGGGYNRQLMTGLLRGRHRFGGIVVSDWAITRDCGENCRTGATPHTFADIATPWGVESLSAAERFVRGVTAGLDQFGGVDESATLVGAVRAGNLTEARIQESALRVLVQKFELGLFENPFVDAERAASVVGRADFLEQAGAAQRRSQVVLENKSGIVPLKAGTRVYLYGIAPAAAESRGLVPVTSVDEAQAAILRLAAPFEVLHPNFFFGRRQHEGRLDFRDGDAGYEQVKLASAKVPTIASVYLDRPAILTNVRDKVQGLLANFGADDAALVDVVTGRATAEGRLPFELPSSMAEVEAQSPGRPHDTRRPLYPIGAGGAAGGTSSR